MSKRNELSKWKLRYLFFTVSLGLGVALLDPRNWISSERRKRATIYYGARLSGYSAQNAIFLVKQSNHETGFQALGFYSKGTNNLFGMHRPFKRQTVNSGSRHNEAEGGEVLVFSSSVQSIVDRILWDKWHSLEGDESYYIEDVQEKGYNPSPDYTSKVESTSLGLDSPIDSLLKLFYVLIVIAVIALFYFFYRYVK